jgi:hypothetical protein
LLAVGLAVLLAPPAVAAPQRAEAIAEKDKLPQNDAMIVFAVEPLDVGPGAAEAFKDLEKADSQKPGTMGVADFAWYREAWYLATNPSPNKGPEHLYLFPTRFPDKERKYAEARLFAAPGEHEPASICIWAKANATDATVSVGDLSNDEGWMIPSDAVDLRLVKWLYVPADVDPKSKAVTQTAFLPLILLHDDALIRPSSAAGDSGASGRNVLYASPTAFEDSEELKPFDLRKDELRQLWLTVRVPQDAAAGIYRGSITVSAGDASIELPLVLEVLPFELSPSRWTCWLFYAGGYRSADTIAAESDQVQKQEPLVYQSWRAGHTAFVHSFYKSDQQIEHELADMKAHGVMAAAIYCPVERALRLMKSSGFGDGKTFLSTDATDAEDGSVTQLLEAGYTDVYLMGADKPSLMTLLTLGRQIENFAAVGARCWTNLGLGEGTLHARSFMVHGNHRTQYTDRGEVTAWREAGRGTTVYGSPYPWLQRHALSFRIAYGLGVWRYGYDGSFDFAYQWHGASPWDFFSLDTNEGFQIGYTLPTSGKPVATLKWECFREGQDDLRYLSTLMDRIDARLAANAEDEKAKAAGAFLETLKQSPQLITTGQRDLQGVRLEVMKQVLELSD